MPIAMPMASTTTTVIAIGFQLLRWPAETGAAGAMLAGAFDTAIALVAAATSC